MTKRLKLMLTIVLVTLIGTGPLLPVTIAAQDQLLAKSRGSAGTVLPGRSAPATATHPAFTSRLLSRRPAARNDANAQSATPGQTATLLSDGRVLKIG